ncbi:hypothetical protein Tco_1072375 [Tanacetum coccineum]
MDTTKAQQKTLDDALVANENRFKIRKCNQRLSPTLKSNEPTIQVVLDALKLTPFYNAFDVSADVPEIYMQEFWSTVTKHHFSLRFKMNGKSHTVNVDNFRDMLKIFPKLPSQKFKDPSFEEEILSFIRDLGHTSKIKVKRLQNQNLQRRKLILNNLPRQSRTSSFIKEKKNQESIQLMESIPCQEEAFNNTKFKNVLTCYLRSLLWQRSLEQMKIALERSKTQQHSSHASGLGAYEGTCVTPGVPDVPSYDSEAEQISWKSSDEEDDDEVGLNDNDDDEDNNDDDDDADNQDDDDQEHDGQDDEEQDDVNEQTDSDNDGDDFVHPKLLTQDQ